MASINYLIILRAHVNYEQEVVWNLELFLALIQPNGDSKDVRINELSINAYKIKFANFLVIVPYFVVWRISVA